MTLLDKELTKAEQGMWWTITAPLAFTKATTDYYSLREKYPKLFSEAKWSRPDTYTSMGFTVAFFKQAQWVYLGAEIDEPEFECPKSYYAASIGGIEGLDFNVPTGILSRSAGDLLQSRIARTPKNMNAKYFKGLSFPLELRSGTKRKSLPSSASLSSSSSSSSSSDSSSSSSDSDSDYGPDPDSDSDGYFSDYDSDDSSSSKYIARPRSPSPTLPSATRHQAKSRPATAKPASSKNPTPRQRSFRRFIAPVGMPSATRHQTKSPSAPPAP